MKLFLTVSTLVLSLLAFNTPVFSAEEHSHPRINNNFKKIKRLQNSVAQLQSQMEALLSANQTDFSGTYTSIFFENQSFSCGDTVDPADPLILGTPAAVPYFSSQGVSSYSVASVITDATANGETLYFPPHSLMKQEQRGGGVLETDTKLEGNFSVNIGPDGALSLDAGPDTTVSGQMTAGGFVMLVQGSSIEDNCDDAFTLMVVGVRKQDLPS